MRLIALVAAYNEERFIAACLDHLIQQGAEVYLIDNDSTDRTAAIAAGYRGRGLLGLERFPRAGFFDWKEVLARIETLAGTLAADWFLVTAPDEIIQAPQPGQTLVQALAAVDAAGYNAVDLLEFAFVPTREHPDHDHPDYLTTMRWYYLHQPPGRSLMRAWKKQAGPLGLIETGGHKLLFPGLRLAPQTFHLRHYLCLSPDHAARKYGARGFDPATVRAGWHGWRARLAPDAIQLPQQADLSEYAFDGRFDTSRPRPRHFLAEAVRPPAASTAVCIAGMHRSGTSLVTQLLHKCGVYLGPDEKMPPPAHDNEAGFWENADFKALNEQLLARLGGGWDLPPRLEAGWEKSSELAELRFRAGELVKTFEGSAYWGWKDPRNSLTLPFWRLLLPDLRVLICVRHPLEVARSLERRGYSTLAFGLWLWEAYYRALLAAVPAERRVLTHYDAYFADAPAELQRVLKQLGLPAPAAVPDVLAGALAPGLRHHSARGRAPGLPGHIDDLYQQLCEEAGYGQRPAGPPRPNLPANPARIRTQRPYEDLRPALEALQAQAAETERRQAELQRELQAHERELAERDATLRAQEQRLAEARAALSSARAEVQRMARSRFWRLGTAYWALRFRLLRLVGVRAEPGPPAAPAAGALPAAPTEWPAPGPTAASAALPQPSGTSADVQALQTRVNELQQQLRRIHTSRAWKVMSWYWRLAAPLKQAGRRVYLGVRALGRRWLPLGLRSWVVGQRRRAGAQPAAVELAPLAFPPPRKPDVVFFGIIDWSFRFQRPQHLALQFARNGHRCFYIGVKFHGAGPAPRVTQLAEGVYDVQLPGPPGLKVYKGQLGAAEAPMLAALDALRRSAGLIDAVCLVQLPFWAPLALAARERWGWKLVYDCLDEHSGFSNMGPGVADSEARLIAESDLVLATSLGLRAKVSAAARRVLLVPNASDFEHFHQVPAEQPLAHLAGTVIGYYGAIAEWFDVDMLAGAARARPHWHFVLIGHTFGADLTALQLLPNVHLLGEKPYGELPAYLQRFDVACIPFKLNALTAATNPVKFYEYLSAGKPVVATALPELEPYRALYYPVERGAGFVAQCEAALRADSPERVAARLDCARANTWAHRFATLEAALPELYGRAVVVIVSFGSLDYLRQCLDSVFEKTLYPNFHVVVVDNGSEPEVTGYLTARAQAEPRLQVILNGANLGFARANNQGIEAAGPCAYVVLLNNDTVVTRGWLGRLVGYLRHPQAGLVGPVTNAIGNEAQVDLGAYTLDDLDSVAAAYQRAHDGEVFDIPVLAMFCVGIRRALLDEVGLLDERYVVGMFEDDDFALRVRRAGYRVLCANDLFIHHWMRAAFKRLPQSEYDQLFRANRQRFEEKWQRPWQPHQGRRPRGPEALGRLAAGRIDWRCNLCGHAAQTALADLQREAASCPVCRSSVRMRAIVHLLSTELFGESLPLADFPARPDLRGLGLSDSRLYAPQLQRKLAYTNTFFHKPPRLDITEIDPALAGTLDFLIASEIFEHVAPPVTRAFANARRLLKPGGVMIFSTPYTLRPATLEHFPDLNEYALTKQQGRPALRNVTRDGHEQIYRELVFHDGPGTTLEMRVFSEQGLRASLAEAGFGYVRFHGEPFFQHGVYWPRPWSLPIVARPTGGA